VPFLGPSDFKHKELAPGVTIRSTAGDRMTLTFFTFAPRSIIKEHKHPHEQVGHVLEGGLEFVIGNEKKVVKAGDTYLIPSNVPHSAVALDTPTGVLDVFSPVREDYK
jgi:quercetin dioxygenase-like cupin family protein